MARFREVFDLVDAALRAGVTRPAVIARLAKLGLELTPATFKSYVERLRREQSLTAIKATETPSRPQAASPVAAAVAPTKDVQRVQQPSATASMPPPADPSRPFDLRAIRAQNYNLEALRARWRKHQREEAAAAKATPPDPGTPAVPTPGPPEPT